MQVSFRLHAVTPEPFLLVGLIAAIRRVLILTAEFGHEGSQGPPRAARAGARRPLGAHRRDHASLFVLRRRDTVDKVAKP